MPGKAALARRGLLCVTCNRNKQRFKDQRCERCHMLVKAEGSAPPEPESPARQKLRKQAHRYNRLARRGFTATQIAEDFKLSRQQVATIVYRAKTILKIKMINIGHARMMEGQMPEPTTEMRKKKNGHGEGRWGIRGCKCDLCVALRKVTRAEYVKTYAPRRREKEEARGYRKKKEE